MNLRTAGILLQIVGGVITCGALGVVALAVLATSRGIFTLVQHLSMMMGLVLLVVGAGLIWLGRFCIRQHDPHPHLTAARWRRVQEGRPASSRAGHKGHIRQ